MLTSAKFFILYNITTTEDSFFKLILVTKLQIYIYLLSCLCQSLHIDKTGRESMNVLLVLCKIYL